MGALNMVGELEPGERAVRIAVPVCQVAIQDNYSSVRKAALNTLCKLVGREQAIECCLPLLKDDNLNVKKAVLNVLRELGNEQTVEYCLTLLEDENSSVRRIALTAIRELGNEQVAVHCLPLLRDDSSAVKKAALVTLCELGDEQVVEHSLPFLKDKNSSVKVAALNILRELGNENAVRQCLTLLQDKVLKVKIAALNTLCELGNNEAKEQCMQILNDHKEELIAQLASANVLWRLSTNCSRTKDYYISNGILQRSFNIRNTPAQMLSQPAKMAMIIISAQTRSKVLINRWIIPCLQDQEDLIRKIAIVELGKLKDNKYIDNVRPLLKDHNRSIREKAKEVIEQ
ncbi:MAG: HEAT repeat domain-containing protein [Candidatus Electrothrix scaldis]|nr:MAG: HEAT repeat domain-containing protein [Candidatus Electrothrix sp. GW3-3]